MPHALELRAFNALIQTYQRSFQQTVLGVQGLKIAVSYCLARCSIYSLMLTLVFASRMIRCIPGVYEITIN